MSAPPPRPPLLDVAGLRVTYGGVVAVSDVDLQIAEGTIYGLIGPNGAGKTSMVDALTGYTRPAAGRITFNGRDIGALRPYRRARLGLARTFQSVELFDDLTVEENLLVASEHVTVASALRDLFGPQRPPDRTGVDLQDTPPSWLTMVDRGATTVWEEWEGVDGHGVPHASLNHYSKGAVAAFLHRYVAGLRLTAPGYRTFEVRPRPGGGITSATTRHVSPFGPIEVSWSLRGRSMELDVLIPPGTTATVTLPGEPPRDAPPGRHRWTSGASEVP